MDNSNKIILDLCGGTGAWSRPYVENGYDVRNITLPENDITKPKTIEMLISLQNVYGILFAMVCTQFSGSGARWWEEKDKDGRTLEDTKILTSGLIIVAYCQPSEFWCLENPIGRLNKWLGKPVMYFNPCDYGDPYTKKTALWGKFNMPKKNPVEPVPMNENPIWNMSPSENRSELRSITPSGFAKAFYTANK